MTPTLKKKPKAKKETPPPVFWPIKWVSRKQIEKMYPTIKKR